MLTVGLSGVKAPLDASTLPGEPKTCLADAIVSLYAALRRWIIAHRQTSYDSHTKWGGRGKGCAEL